MNKINRTKIPECLREKAEEWTADLIEKRKTKARYWYWHKYKKQKVSQLLSEELSEMTNFHCSFCGIYPLKQFAGGRSIDHFKPKTKFPEKAFDWNNLFISCSDCQNIKGGNFPDIEPIKPDNPNYNFDYWFKINWENNFIIPNTLRTLSEQNIAQKTINWLGLNKGERPDARNDELEKYRSSDISNVQKWSYPYFLERA